MTIENEIVVYQGNLPLPVSQKVERQFKRQKDQIVAAGEIGMVGMSAISEVERHAAFKVATTAAASCLLAKGAAARANANSHGGTGAYCSTGNLAYQEQEALQRLFEDYMERMEQVAQITTIRIVQAVDRGIDRLGKQSLSDVLESIDAWLADAIWSKENSAGSPKGK